MNLFNREIVDCQRSARRNEKTLRKCEIITTIDACGQRSLFRSSLNQLSCNKICNLNYLASIVRRNVGIQVVRLTNCFRTRNICRRRDFLRKNNWKWNLPKFTAFEVHFASSFLLKKNQHSFQLQNHKWNPHKSAEQSKFVQRHLSPSKNAENHLARVRRVTIAKQLYDHQILFNLWTIWIANVQSVFFQLLRSSYNCHGYL